MPSTSVKPRPPVGESVDAVLTAAGGAVPDCSLPLAPCATGNPSAATTKAKAKKRVVRTMAESSESVLHCELDDAAVVGRRDAAKVWRPDLIARLAKPRLVEQIERFDAKLQSMRSVQIDITHERERGARESRSAYAVARRRAGLCGFGNRPPHEARRVEPLIDGVRRVFVRVARLIGSIRQVQDAGIRIEDGRRKSGLRLHDSAPLPAAEQRGTDRAKPIGRRKLRRHADGNALPHVEQRIALFKCQRTLDRRFITD